ncbi:MAG: primase C-terminal domain-containing protein, partial [Clostridia bacterium]|nr:primase C-terminal domain-containing protein [Clostridia bacterium]
MADILFKGYVPVKNKKCTMSFRNKTAAELLTLDQVEHMREYAGILDDETILIDIDDKDQSDILFSIVEGKNLLCRVYETTRGKHFLFKRGEVDRCGTHKKTAIGIECDIKVGNRNSYEVLKKDGKNRPIIYDILDGEEYQEVPKWLTVVNARDISFLDMETGDGRNQALFNYILTLQGNGFSVEDARETIRIINDYILTDPLDDKELETILRDDA